MVAEELGRTFVVGQMMDVMYLLENPMHLTCVENFCGERQNLLENFFMEKNMKAESLFLTNLWFKAFLLGECKIPSSEMLFENTLEFHRDLKEAVGYVRIIHIEIQ